MIERRDLGKFIVFEGSGGAGKDSVLCDLDQYLTSLGIDYVITREPGGSVSAELIRQLIFDSVNFSDNPEEQVELFSAARMITAHKVVKPALLQKKHVLLNRSFPSTAVYQGIVGGVALNIIESWTRTAMGDVLPDAIILLDVDPQIAMNRRSQDTGGDPFDERGLAYFTQIIKGYQQLSDTNWMDLNWIVIDANRDIESVRADVRLATMEILNHRRIY